jgi:hypothetical protein
MSMKYCAHWELFRSNLRGTSTVYRLTMLYWYWTLSEVACSDCSFQTNCQRILGYLRELEKAKKIKLAENFKFDLHWDCKITIREDEMESAS